MILQKAYTNPPEAFAARMPLTMVDKDFVIRMAFA
jgi:hypothetical protein